ncbi:MAG: CCA tRNA nucleotidyltransferase [Elusimicrobia bacterium]|nr:CCA tRNA nucleotidyltransferase [Elusimicrobiota bacterium]
MKTAAATVAVPAAAARLLKPLADEAKRRGLPLYVVGGPVRDWLLKRSTYDLDLAVAGDPDPVANLCAKLTGGAVEPFGRFGTRRIIGRGRYRVDVATTRSETYASPAALPDVTAVGVPIEQDLFRRDFTINAMAVRLDDGSKRLVDPYGGLRDLKGRTLRVLHPASFRDDPTRVFRAARFLGRLHYKPADGMGGEAKDVLKMGEAGKLSRHRVLHELLCLLGEKNPALAFGLLEMWGYLPLIHPDLPWREKMPEGVEARLAAMALALGNDKGGAFIDSFPFEHHLRAQLHEAVALAFSDKSPKATPSQLVAAAVRRAAPKLPPSALKACFLRGSDLIALGRKPGPEFQKALDEAARLQRLGRLKTRAAALAWLRTA